MHPASDRAGVICGATICWAAELPDAPRLFRIRRWPTLNRVARGSNAMPEIPTGAVYLLAAAVALLLYVLAWRATRPLSSRAKLVARGGIAILLFAPLLAVVTLDSWMPREASAVSEPTAGATPPIEIKPSEQREPNA